jgi:hypothetical protein
MSVTLYIAFAQIGPLLQPPSSTPANANPEVALKQQLDRLEATAKQADLEATRLVQMELSPFGGDPQALKEVQKSTKEWLVHNTIRNDPMVKDAFGRELMRRRVDAPAGARGNR